MNGGSSISEQGNGGFKGGDSFVHVYSGTMVLVRCLGLPLLWYRSGMVKLFLSFSILSYLWTSRKISPYGVPSRYSKNRVMFPLLNWILPSFSVVPSRSLARIGGSLPVRSHCRMRSATKLFLLVWDPVPLI